MRMRFQTKSAIITGGAGNLGLAAAQRLVSEGCRVLLVDLNEKALQRAADSLGSDRVARFVADVRSC